MNLRVPYTQQFSPGQTPLKQLLPILRQNSGKTDELRKAVAAAFFRTKADPEKLAGNTLIALRFFGIIDQNSELTGFGEEMVACQGSEEQAHRLLAKRLLLDLGGIGIVETLREMKRANLKIALTTLPNELRQRGFEASTNSSDLSGVLNWLRQARVLVNYDVNESEYSALIGTQPEALDAMKGLTKEQVAFLRAIVALNVRDWTPYNAICKHAEELYPGEVRYNWKEIVLTVLKPLAAAGLVEVRKKAKKAKDSPEGRGGKPADIRPTGKFEAQVAEPLLRALYGAAGFAEVREIRSKSFAEIVAEIEQGQDQNKRGKGLELLAIRLCQILDLEFMGWRETDVALTGGGEVGAFLRSARPPYSRWQLLCSVGPITIDAVSTEVGIQKATLANVILLVSTQNVTARACDYRRELANAINPNIIFIGGPALAYIVDDQSVLHSVLFEQSAEAIHSTQLWSPWGLARRDNSITMQGA